MAKNKEYLNEIDGYIKNLEKIKGREVAVGIPASANKLHKSEDGSTATLVEIGTTHEYGRPEQGIPQRSFLRVPLFNDKEKLFKTLNRNLSQKKMKPLKALQTLGAMGRNSSLDAFNTQGNGQWAELTSREGQPLVDTGQLRQSITWEVRRASKSK